MDMFVCVSVCLSGRISPEPHVRSLPNFCACCLCPWRSPPPDVDDRPHCIWWEGGDGSVQCGRNVIYNCIVCYFVWISCFSNL